MIGWSTAQRYSVLAFMGSVTVVLIAFLVVEMSQGLDGLPGIVVYGVAATFGLEYIGSVWSGYWRERSGSATPRRNP